MLEFGFKVLQNGMDSEISNEGCQISGLFLEGACWDDVNGYLIDSSPKILIYKMPYIALIPQIIEKVQIFNKKKDVKIVKTEKKVF